MARTPNAFAALLALVAGLTLVAATPLQADDGTRFYRLTQHSTYESGCFPPCLCPVFLAESLRGTFRLTRTGFDGLFETFAVDQVSWVVTSGSSEEKITGSGTYRRSVESAPRQQLELDLVIGQGQQHFDSGLVPVEVAFPAIRVKVSKNHMYCYDTVIGIDAVPVTGCGLLRLPDLAARGTAVAGLLENDPRPASRRCCQASNSYSMPKRS
jgi:hypothetical protein